MGKSSAFTNELLFLDCVAFKLTRNDIVQETWIQKEKQCEASMIPSYNLKFNV